MEGSFCYLVENGSVFGGQRREDFFLQLTVTVDNQPTGEIPQRRFQHRQAVCLHSDGLAGHGGFFGKPLGVVRCVDAHQRGVSNFIVNVDEVFGQPGVAVKGLA